MKNIYPIINKFRNSKLDWLFTNISACVSLNLTSELPVGFKIPAAINSPVFDLDRIMMEDIANALKIRYE